MTPLSVPERVPQGLGVTDPGDIDLEAIAWTMGAEVRYRPLELSWLGLRRAEWKCIPVCPEF